MAAAISRALRAEGIVADVANTGTRGVAMAHGEQYDVLILDVMLPDFDGVEVCRRLRRDNVWVPIIMLTARDAIEDRVRGLDQGADDYVTKPFSLAELLARLRALARRGPVARADGPRGRRAAPRPGDAPGLARRHRDRAVGAGVLASRDVHAPPGPGAQPPPAPRRRMGPRLRAALERGGGLHPLSAREDRPPVRRWKSIETVRGFGYRLRRDGGA